MQDVGRPLNPLPSQGEEYPVCHSVLNSSFKYNASPRKRGVPGVNLAASTWILDLGIGNLLLVSLYVLFCCLLKGAGGQWPASGPGFIGVLTFG